MSTPLPLIDLTGASVGTQKSLNFSQFVKVNPMYPSSVKAHLGLFNESGCGLQLTMQASGRGQYLPAGAWTNIEIESNDGAISVTVIYTLPNPPVSMLNVVYYAPGEGIPDSYTLGNSPIGIGGTVNTSSVQTLSNEGNALSTLVFDAGPAGNTNVIQIYNDHFVWSVVVGGVAHTVLQGQTTGNPLLIGKAGDISEVLGNLKVDGSSNLDGGNITTSGTGDVTLKSISIPFGGTAPKISNDGSGNINIDVPTGTRIAQVNTTGIDLTTNAGTNNLTAQNVTSKGTLTAPSSIINTVNSQAATDLVLNVPTGQALRVKNNNVDLYDFLVNQLSMNPAYINSSAGDMIFNVQTGNTIRFRVNNVDQAHIDVNGVWPDSSNAINFLAGRLFRLKTGHSAVLTATITHGLGATPQIVLMTTDIGQPGSSNVGAGSVGATTFAGSGAAGSGWWWLCSSG